MAFDALIFEKGKTYRVVQSFSKFSDNFCEGDKLLLLDETYSRYDGLRIYSFRNIATGKDVLFQVGDDESIQDWTRFFESI